MNTVFVWVSEWGNIDVSEFSHLKFRKDGWFDGRRKDEYYREIKEHIQRKEAELVKCCEAAWNTAEIMPNVEVSGPRI